MAKDKERMAEAGELEKEKKRIHHCSCVLIAIKSGTNQIKWPKLHPNWMILTCIFFSFAIGRQPLSMERESNSFLINV